MNLDKKKATDLATSASTDMNQSLNLDINIIPNSQQIINKNALETMSLGEIYDTVFQPKTQIIEGMLQTGAYLFVGAPKIGKSFLMAQIGYCVSKGLPFWGFKIYQGTVLYLALEDDYSRIQQRLCTMFGEEDNDNLYFATRSQNLSEGLRQQLEKFLSEHPDTKLIIIDTLHKIREKGSDKYSYANDNDVASAVKEFAEQHNICILVVHHTRKGKSDDPFEDISGTNGLLGAVDGAFIMYKKQRNESAAIIDLEGRDVKNQRFNVSFDTERCLWHLESVEQNLKPPTENPLLKSLFLLLSDGQPLWQGTASELIDTLELADITPNVLTRRLNVSVDELANRYGISLKYKRTHTDRLIILEKTE
ncbi:MAG: AAA family ATPase [Clostridiales bacterium]|jgi:RecA-family ATPase|nr:AAA family ATPase [Clostridiales bacterium]